MDDSPQKDQKIPPKREGDAITAVLISQLAAEACQLQDQLTLSNGQIGAEYSRWKVERRGDTIRNMLRMSQAYLSYWSNVAGAWREAIDALERAQSDRSHRLSSPHHPGRDSSVPSTEPDSVAESTDRRRTEAQTGNRLDLDGVDLGSDEFYLAPAELCPNGDDDWTPSDSPETN
ncbi:unnamed protein product [Echinostoma caproni]|uniref:Uncharacterized protein n=1 Tax=Echinostoma caproni TaxID=27848 RepID=A0A183B412_9TREM|nr:unnamed protein product [Echinostoma caproni]